MKTIGWVLVALLSATAGPTHAQRADPDGHSKVLVAGITEGPDPIPQIFWGGVDRIYPPMDLPPDRSDGRPDVTRDPAGHPVVAWAYKLRGDHDVALLRWSGSAWLPVELVARTAADEIDPRAFASPSGQIHVVWWVPGSPERVDYAQGRPGSFGNPRTVAAGARRPSVTQWGPTVLVAFERDLGPGRQQIAVASAGVGGSFVEAPVLEVQRGEPLDVVLHQEAGQLWMDWKSSAAEMAYSKYSRGRWSEPVAVPWSNPTWAGSEDVRKAIRDLVLGQ